MSNPWAQTYNELRRPYLEEKKAKKDHDGDGKVESGSKEHAGAVHNAIQRAKGGKADGKDTRKEAFSMAADPEKRALPRPTNKAENKKGVSAKSRTMKAVGTQRRQDKEVGISGKKNPRGYPRAYREETEVVDEGKKQLPMVKMFRKAGNLGRDGSPEAMERSKKITGVMNANAERRAAHRAKDDAAKDAKASKKMKKEEVEVEGYVPMDSAKKEKIGRQSNKAYAKEVVAARHGKEKEANKQMQRRIAMQDPAGRKASLKKEETAIEEGSMSTARKNVGASTCWKGYKAKGTKSKGGRTVPNCVKERSDWREEMGDDGFFSEAAKRQNDLDIKTSGVKNKIEINPEIKTEGVDKRRAPAELVARMSAKREGEMAHDGPNKPASDAKARIMAKTKKKREQAKENIMKGPLLPGEGRKVFPKGAAPKATGAKLPLQTASYNPMLDSVEAQALQMFERTRYAKEKGTDSQTGKESKSGGTIKPGSAMSKVRKSLAGQGLMSSRGKAIQPQGKKKDKGAKGYQGQTPVDKIKGNLARKRAPKPNPYKPRAGESD